MGLPLHDVSRGWFGVYLTNAHPNSEARPDSPPTAHQTSSGNLLKCRKKEARAIRPFGFGMVSGPAELGEVDRPNQIRFVAELGKSILTQLRNAMENRARRQRR
jgi:hypothetical protein